MKAGTIFPFANVLMPAAATAGTVAKAVNAALAQIKSRLESEVMITFHKVLFYF